MQTGLKERVSPDSRESLIGKRVSWMTVSGPNSGVVDSLFNNDYMIRLDNGKYVIVGEKSILF